MIRIERALLLSLALASCRSTVDTSEALGRLVASRPGAELHVRERGEPRALARVERDLRAGDADGGRWWTTPLADLGAVPTPAFHGADVWTMTSDVVVGGTSERPEVVQLSRLWRSGPGAHAELVFETRERLLGEFVPLDAGHALALSFDAEADGGERFGTALVRFEDGGLANLPLFGFRDVRALRLDPADETPVLVGQRPAGDRWEWGLFRLEGVERHAVLFEPHVVAPAFSEDGETLAYAWRADRGAARVGDDLDDGPFRLVSWVDRASGAARHVDVELDVSATSFDPADRDRLLVLGRAFERRGGGWELVELRRERDGLRIVARGPFPAPPLPEATY